MQLKYFVKQRSLAQSRRPSAAPGGPNDPSAPDPSPGGRAACEIGDAAASVVQRPTMAAATRGILGMTGLPNSGSAELSVGTSHEVH
jgi:hypothetical protein